MISILTPDHPSVVAKVLKPSSSVKSTAVMWLRETSIHSKLSAGGLPTIVQLLGLDARLHSLYLEDIAAPSLAQRAWRGPDDYFSGTPADARRVLDDMASALAFVHGNGITHNDVKPGNILFSPARGAVLIDFGLSSDSTRASAAATQTAGTPWYVPPEFMDNPLTGRGPPGDVWALGVVMLYLRRRLRIPDKSTDWQIWAVTSQRSPDAVAAMGKMSIWVAKVLAERAQLGLDQMDEVIRGMTEPQRSDRSTINAVVKALGCREQEQEGN
jgi:serine/threonine protein kinase